MAKRILVEEFHLTVYALRGLATGEYDALRQALDDPLFLARLRRAVRRHSALGKTNVRLSR